MQTLASHETFTTAGAGVATRSRGAVWTGRGLSGIAVLFLVFDSVGKLLRVQPVIDGTRELGYPVSSILPMGIVLLACAATYVFRPTSVLGAVLLTGYLGGAVATHLRVGNPLFTHMLFPIYVGFFIWGGLFLRDARLRALFPWRR
jgi:hypothetical protein